MATNLVITIGRQFGSGGRKVGKLLAEKLDIPYYDKELLAEAAKDSGICQEIFENHDEKNYEIYIELEKETQINANELASKLNEILIESFELYELYNRMGLMTPLKVILMKNGWIESLYAMKSKGNVPKSQIKLPLIITEKPDKEYIL